MSGAWYRGHPSYKYSLLPKLFRRPLKEDGEGQIYKAYLRTRMAKNHNNSWSHLIDMQHYGTATRLLDWTECFAVALYFALKTDTPSDPCIWVLNPFTLACRARGNNDKSIGDFHLDENMDYYLRFIKRKDWPFRYPMPFFAPAPNERIRVQRGFFTVHGTDSRSLDQTCAYHARCILIPPEALEDAYIFLELAGVDDLFLFPDAEGWLRKIDKDYFY